MILNITYLILGLVLLVVGGHFLVEAGVSAARKFKIAPFIVGATVVAFGTSAPELLVSLNAAISGHPEIALGNVVGSNIANIALVLGATSCLITLPVVSKRLFTDWLLVIITSILLIVFASNGSIASLEGIILFAILLRYIYSAIRQPKEDIDHEDEIKTYSNWGMIILIFLVAGAGLALGADFLVRGASNIARSLHISERVISITIVAFGTSLPELATSLIAAFKKQTDISVGNIIGSNLFNILAVVGITTILQPIEVSFSTFSMDLYIMLAVALLLILFLYPYRANFTTFKQNRKIKQFISLDAGQLSWRGGILLLLIYAAYVAILFVRA